MQDYKEIGKIAAHLEQLHASLRGEIPSLEETVNKVNEAAQVYREFQKQIAQESFEVFVVDETPTNGLNEKPFDWQALEGG